MSIQNTQLSQLGAALKVIENKCCVPEGYEFVGMRQVIQDARPLALLRFQRSDGRNNFNGGEHFSTLVNIDENRLEGLLFIDHRFTVEIDIDDEQVRASGRQFLTIAAPDLLDRVEERWIKPMRRVPQEPPHDAPFEFTDAISGKIMFVIGKRFKMFDPETKTWAWIIIASDGTPIAFERDISWDGVRKRRMTEQWLYDPWVERLLHNFSN
jgi:hypothetical protein